MRRNIKKSKQIVLEELAENPLSRDSDLTLHVNFWKRKLKMIIGDYKNLSFLDFCEIIIHGQLGAIETIRRTRQKTQNDNLDLRGKKYDKNHKNHIQLTLF